MRKVLFLIGYIMLAVPVLFARTAMTNPYGFSYSNYFGTLTGLSFENIPSDMYAVLTYYSNMSLNDVGFQYNNGRGLYIHSYNTVPNMNKVDFIQNANGGAYITQKLQTTLRTTSFKSNSATYGGGIYATKELGINGTDLFFLSNQATKGGAIYAEDNLVLAGSNIQFIGNNATYGGAIYALKNVTLSANGGDITFSGNTGHAVYLENADSGLSLQTVNNGRILVYDTIAANGKLHVQMSGDGEVHFYKAPANTSLTLEAGKLYLSPSENWQNTPLTVTGGQLLTNTQSVNHFTLGTVTLNGTLHIVPNVDFQTGVMDTLSISQTTGGGHIQVDGFRFLTTPTQEKAVFAFMQGSGKNNVQVPDTVYSSVYAYQVSYNPLIGTITFIPLSTQTTEGFNPAALMQPVWSYSSLKLLEDSLRPLRARAHTRYISYEDVPASFYVTPYMWGGKTEISSLAVEEKITGVQAGWDSADLGLLESAVVTGGFNVGIAHNGLSYKQNAIDTSLYQAGGNLRIYAGNLFGEITTQAAWVDSQLKTVPSDAKSVAVMGQTEIGYNIDISGQIWFLRPSASYSYGRLGMAKNVDWEGTVLTSVPVSFSQVKGGASLINTHEEKWHGYVGLWYVNPLLGKALFQAGKEQIPNLEIKPYMEFSAGFQTESAERFIWGVELMGSFGSSRQFGGNLTVQF